MFLSATLAVTASDSARPAPGGIEASVVDGQVRLTWVPPSGTEATIRQTGCDPMDRVMGLVYQNFTRSYPTIEVVLRDGGNYIGFTEWIAGRSDVNQNSRAITSEERAQAEAAGLEVTETMVGLECIAVITDPGAGVSELSTGQLRDVFTGAVTNWREVGGADLAIRPYMSETGEADPYSFFRNIILNGATMAGSVVKIGDGIELAGKVADTSGSIGIIYSGFLSRAEGVRVIALKASADGVAVSPLDLDAVYGGSYLLARQYRLFTDGPMEGAVGDWASFILESEGGQKVLSDNGFLPLREGDRAASVQNIASTSEARVIGYKVYRESGNGEVRTFDATGTALVDTSVQSNTTYTYSVAALYQSGAGQRSGPFEVTVPNGGTAVPSGVTDLSGILAVGAGVTLTAGALALWSRKKRSP